MISIKQNNGDLDKMLKCQLIKGKNGSFCCMRHFYFSAERIMKWSRTISSQCMADFCTLSLRFLLIMWWNKKTPLLFSLSSENDIICIQISCLWRSLMFEYKSKAEIYVEVVCWKCCEYVIPNVKYHCKFKLFHKCKIHIRKLRLHTIYH